MKTVSIVNVTSYTALTLMQLLARHPEFELVSVTGRSAVGRRIEDIFPELVSVLPPPGHQKRALNPALLISDQPEKTDLTFVCLPHTAAAEAVGPLLEQGTKVVDLSADFRLHDVKLYEEWYKHTHLAPQLLPQAVFGLPEFYRQQIKQANLVANPGCHSTVAILALIPALEHGIIRSDLIVDSKTGVSGAGRTPSQSSHYSEVNENFHAYSLNGHRHQAEIAQEGEIAAVRGGHPLSSPLRLTFLPHLVPMTRGILSTCYVDLTQEASQMSSEEIRALYREYYKNEPFVHIVDQAPHTKWTSGSNHCFIHPYVEKRTNRLIIISCLDNLMKGAAGQALQNANLMFDFSETLGLESVGVTP